MVGLSVLALNNPPDAGREPSRYQGGLSVSIDRKPVFHIKISIIGFFKVIGLGPGIH